MLAVGEHYMDSVPDSLKRASGAFAGGAGCGFEELCGILSGGLMVLGVVQGRDAPTEDDKAMQERSRRLRDRFLDAFGATKCATIRGRQPEGQKRCRSIVREGVRIIVEVMEEARES